ncbi:MAG: hypothetical protein ABI885_14655 [Gammaproteobacteria bacterium]
MYIRTSLAYVLQHGHLISVRGDNDLFVRGARQGIEQNSARKGHISFFLFLKGARTLPCFALSAGLLEA